MNMLFTGATGFVGALTEIHGLPPPGLTSRAQINGWDVLPIPVKVAFDE